MGHECKKVAWESAQKSTFVYASVAADIFLPKGQRCSCWTLAAHAHTFLHVRFLTLSSFCLLQCARQETENAQSWTPLNVFWKTSVKQWEQSRARFQNSSRLASLFADWLQAWVDEDFSQTAISGMLAEILRGQGGGGDPNWIWMDLPLTSIP